ncbi:MAG: hypothetical protein SGPRY_007561, partial [Prymnesium sp.]
MNKKSTPENQRKRSWKSYLLTTFKNRRLRTYKGATYELDECVRDKMMVHLEDFNSTEKVFEESKKCWEWLEGDITPSSLT